MLVKLVTCHGNSYRGKACSDLDMTVRLLWGAHQDKLSPPWTGLEIPQAVAAPAGLLMASPKPILLLHLHWFEEEEILQQHRTLRRVGGQHRRGSYEQMSGLSVRCAGPGQWHLSLQVATTQS